MMRLVSLLASGTEIVCALGAGDWLVGRPHECDNPAWVRALPACTRPAFAVDVSSREIDADVRRIASGEPLYHVDTDLTSSEVRQKNFPAISMPLPSRTSAATRGTMPSSAIRPHTGLPTATRPPVEVDAMFAGL